MNLNPTEALAREVLEQNRESIPRMLETSSRFTLQYYEPEKVDRMRTVSGVGFDVVTRAATSIYITFENRAEGLGWFSPDGWRKL